VTVPSEQPPRAPLTQQPPRVPSEQPPRAPLTQHAPAAAVATMAAAVAMAAAGHGAPAAAGAPAARICQRKSTGRAVASVDVVVDRGCGFMNVHNLVNTGPGASESALPTQTRSELQPTQVQPMHPTPRPPPPLQQLWPRPRQCSSGGGRAGVGRTSHPGRRRRRRSRSRSRRRRSACDGGRGHAGVTVGRTASIIESSCRRRPASGWLRPGCPFACRAGCGLI
jgi:hypothetical protein